MHINQGQCRFIKLHVCALTIHLNLQQNFTKFLLKHSDCLKILEWVFETGRKMLIRGEMSIYSSLYCICSAQKTDLDWLLLIGASSNFYASRQLGSVLVQQ